MARRISGQSIVALLLLVGRLGAQQISADSLRGHLSFLASDLLEGRATPSRGLDLAASYIAAQFRRAGLEPAGGDDYFQTASVLVHEPNYDGFELQVSSDGNKVTVDKTNAYLVTRAPLRLDDQPLVMLDVRPRPELVDGKVVVVLNPRTALGLQQMHPALVIREVPELPTRLQVSDPENRRTGIPILYVTTKVPIKEGSTLTLHAAAGAERPVPVRNVAGILRGSDPVLRDTYVLLTAHYDHVGMRSTGDDRIYNGANDDGSGTVSVIEIASALAALPERPKRSIVFMTFFGEEEGLYGSSYYGRHPLVPLSKTIADLNLEQVGRTDATNGPQVARASLTGYDYSDLPAILAKAARPAGVEIYRDEDGSESFFARSDNQALADAGIPAHTLYVALEFPDYHQVSDEWQKIDYVNMALIDRAVELGVLRLASDAPPPHWSESSEGARRYLDAAKKLSP